MRRRRFFRRGFRRSAPTRHWHGFELTGNLTAVGTFASAAVMVTTDYELSPNLQAAGLLERVVGHVNIRTVSTTAGTGTGYFGLIVCDQDLAPTNAQFDLSADSVTDESWLHIGSYAWSQLGGAGPNVSVIPYDIRVKRRLKDSQLIFVFTLEEISGATPDVHFLTEGRCLLRKVG